MGHAAPPPALHRLPLPPASTPIGSPDWAFVASLPEGHYRIRWNWRRPLTSASWLQVKRCGANQTTDVFWTRQRDSFVDSDRPFVLTFDRAGEVVCFMEWARWLQISWGHGRGTPESRDRAMTAALFVVAALRAPGASPTSS